jgi:hypothetical protein
MNKTQIEDDTELIINYSRGLVYVIS